MEAAAGGSHVDFSLPQLQGHLPQLQSHLPQLEFPIVQSSTVVPADMKDLMASINHNLYLIYGFEVAPIDPALVAQVRDILKANGVDGPGPALNALMAQALATGQIQPPVIVPLQAPQPSTEMSDEDTITSPCTSTTGLFVNWGESFQATLTEVLQFNNFGPLLMPEDRGTDDDGYRPRVMERLHDVCMWIFDKSDFVNMCDNAHDVMPRDDDDPVDVTIDTFFEKHLFCTSPSAGSATLPMTDREANFVWTLTVGQTRRPDGRCKFNMGIKDFVLGIIENAKIPADTAVQFIHDAVPHALIGKRYAPSSHILSLPVPHITASQVNNFLRFHLAADEVEFRFLLHQAHMAVFLSLPPHLHLEGLINSGERPTIASMIATYANALMRVPVIAATHSAPTAPPAEASRATAEVTATNPLAMRKRHNKTVFEATDGKTMVGTEERAAEETQVAGESPVKLMKIASADLSILLEGCDDDDELPEDDEDIDDEELPYGDIDPDNSQPGPSNSDSIELPSPAMLPPISHIANH